MKLINNLIFHSLRNYLFNFHFTTLHVSTLKDHHQVFLNTWCLSFTACHSLFTFTCFELLTHFLILKCLSLKMYNTPLWGERVEFIKLLLELKILLKILLKLLMFILVRSCLKTQHIFHLVIASLRCPLSFSFVVVVVDWCSFPWAGLL
jgi:hypothetical protein